MRLVENGRVRAGAEHRAAEFEYDQRARRQPFATGGSESRRNGHPSLFGHEPSLINTGNFLESGRSNDGNLARAFCGASEVRRGLSPEILGIQPPPGVRCILDKPFESSRAGMTYHVILRAAGRSL